MHVVIGLLVLFVVLVMLGIALDYVFHFLLLILVNIMTIFDSLFSAIGNYAWLIKLENGKLSQLSEQAGALFSKVSTPYPFVAWGIFGFIFGTIGYFYLIESDKLNRPSLKPAMLVLLVFFSLSNIFANSSISAHFPSLKSDDVIFDTSPTKLVYKLSDMDQPIKVELRRPGYYKLSAYDKSIYQTSAYPGQYPIIVDLNGNRYESNSSSIFDKPFKINEPTTARVWFKHQYKSTKICYFKIDEIQGTPKDFINIPGLSKNDSNQPKGTVQQATPARPGQTLYCIAQGGINLRSGTTTSDRILGRIALDEKVTVLEQINKNDGNLYYRVQKANGLTGWAWGGTRGKETFSSRSETVSAPTKFSTMQLREKSGLKLNAKISCIDVNKSCGTYNFEELGCKGSLVFKRADNSFYYFTETNETTGCVVGCSLAISKNGKQYKETCGSLTVEGSFN